MLAAANLRKSKSQTASMMILILIAAMFLNIGLVLFFEVGNFFDERAEELNAPHFVAFTHDEEQFGVRYNFIKDFDGVEEIETQSVLRAWGGFFINDNLSSGTLVVSTKNDEQTMNPPSLVGDYLPLINNAVYIPHFMFLSGGFSLGDEIEFNFLQDDFVLTIAGSTEEIMFGDGMMINTWRIYVSDDKFAALYAEHEDARITMLSARMTHGWEALTAAFQAELRSGELDIVLNYNHVHSARTMIPTIASLMIVAFSLILLIIVAIVARFRISNDIEESMTNIGVLKASGYRSRQIMSSIVLQFTMITFTGGMIGIALAQLALPLVTGILEPMLALPWNPSFNIFAMALALALIFVLILLFVYITSRRINKLHPLVALRGGKETQKYKKNHLPLEKTRASLGVVLAAKHLFQNIRQTIMVAIIVGALAFAGASGLILNHNVNVDMTAFLNVIFGETPDAAILLNDPNESADFIAYVEANLDIETIYGYQTLPLLINGETVNFEIVQDFSYLEGHALISGRFPASNSEIVVDGAVLSTLGKQVGDVVTVSSGDIERDFTITGIVQIWGGFFAMMDFESMIRVQPDFIFSTFYVNLTENADIDLFAEQIRAIGSNTEGGLLIVLFQEQIDATFAAMGDIFSIVNIIILLVVAGVIVLVLYLLVKTMVIRRRREFGTQKALGFTTFQLMNQIALGLTPPVIIGVVLGSVGGYLGFNHIFVMLTSGMGIASVNLFVPINWLIVVSIGIIVLAYATSIAIAWRIRKISAYALVTE